MGHSHVGGFNGSLSWAVICVVVRCMMTMSHEKISQLENVATIAMYCHLRPHDAIAFPT